MKPKTRIVFDIDAKKVTDIYYGDDHYKVEGECNQCGECCKISPPFWFRDKEGKCIHLGEDNLCHIDSYYVPDEDGDHTKPWFCRFWPYDLEAFLMNPEKCSYKLTKVN